MFQGVGWNTSLVLLQPCHIMFGQCTLRCLIRSLAKSDSKFKTTFTQQRADGEQPQCWNTLTKRAAGSIPAYNDFLLQERHLTTHIYCPAYNVFQEILLSNPHPDLFLRTKDRVVLILAHTKKRRNKEKKRDTLTHICTYKYSGCCCCCCSVTNSGPTLCNLTDCSTPGSSVLYYLLEFAQFHVHWVSVVI